MARRIPITPGAMVRSKGNRNASMWQVMTLKDSGYWRMNRSGMGAYAFIGYATCIAVPGRFGAFKKKTSQGAVLLMLPHERLNLFWAWAEDLMVVVN